MSQVEAGGGREKRRREVETGDLGLRSENRSTADARARGRDTKQVPKRESWP